MRTALRLTKLDCAKRQLETAIKLFFGYGDPVSIHTLAAAAYSILSAINRGQRGAPMVSDFVYFTPKAKKDLVRLFNRHDNFFKHAARDAYESTLFGPKETEFKLVEACSKYCELAGEVPYLVRVFMWWQQLWNPELYSEPDDATKTAILHLKGIFTEMERVEYFEVVMHPTFSCKP